MILSKKECDALMRGISGYGENEDLSIDMIMKFTASLKTKKELDHFISVIKEFHNSDTVETTLHGRFEYYFECELCRKRYYFQNELTRHMEFVKNGDSMVVTFKPERPLVRECEECGKKLTFSNFINSSE